MVFFGVTVIFPVFSTTTIWNEREPSAESAILIEPAAAAGTVRTSRPSRYTWTTDCAGAFVDNTTVEPTTLVATGRATEGIAWGGIGEPRIGLSVRFVPGN